MKSFSSKKLYKTLSIGIGLTIVTTIFSALGNDVKAQECLNPHDRGILNEYIRGLKMSENDVAFANLTVKTVEHIRESVRRLIDNYEFEKAIIFCRDYRRISEKESFPDMAKACDELLVEAEEKYEIHQQQLEDFKKADLEGLYSILKYFHDTSSWANVPQHNKDQIDRIVMDRIVHQGELLRKQNRITELRAYLTKLKVLLTTMSLKDYSFRHSLSAINNLIRILDVN